MSQVSKAGRFEDGDAGRQKGLCVASSGERRAVDDAIEGVIRLAREEAVSRQTIAEVLRAQNASDAPLRAREIRICKDVPDTEVG